MSGKSKKILINIYQHLCISKFQYALIALGQSLLQSNSLTSSFKSLKKELDPEIIMKVDLNMDKIKDLALEFLKKANNSLVQDNVSTLSDVNSQIFQNMNHVDWAILETVRNFYFLLFESSEWNLKDYGSFLAITLKLAKYHDCHELYPELRVHHYFTIANYNISLPEISFLYSTMNDDILTQMIKKEYNDQNEKLPDQWSPSEFLNIPDTFKACFKSKNEAGSVKGSGNSIAGDFIPKGNGIKPSICANLTIPSKCSAYCNWHAEVIQKQSKKTVVSLMGLSLPPRKGVLEPLTSGHSDLETELFDDAKPKAMVGDDRKINLNSLILFCYDRVNGLQGDDIGMSGKLCNDFYPTPTDMGMCLTRNLNIKDILHANHDYEDIFAGNDKKPKKFNGRNLWSEMTLIISSNAEYKDLRQSLPRKPKVKTSEIYLQIHHPKELAKFHLEDTYNIHNAPLKLMNEKAYLIDVTPTGTIASERFKGRNVKDRNCFTKTDKWPASKSFKMYDQNNCKYECLVKLAQDLCKCIPWDFIDFGSRLPECDVFGRTCFFEGIKNLTRSRKNMCPHCLEDCQYTKYEMIFLPLPDFRIAEPPQCPNSQLIKEGKNWINSKYEELDDILMDTNNTITELDLKKAFNDLFLGTCDDPIRGRLADKYMDLIMVQIRFRTPKIISKDTKYALIDKLAALGGNYGIFAELTGCSLLGFLNVIILSMKLICTCNKNHI